ncbi:7784_t:CDS:2, partial [Acaulospora morrowiae]
WEAMRQYRRLNSNTREQLNNDDANGEDGPDFRISFESTHSYALQNSRGYPSTNDFSASQDALLEQVLKLTKISQQNQDTLEKILRTLEQNDIKLSDTPDKTSTPDESDIPDEIMTPEKSFIPQIS